jgi:tRNA A-37 threonylcarbamoyl transferase component Bud32
MSDAAPIKTLRGGRYVIVGELGAGSQAETLDAVDKQAGRAVAIKRFQVRGAKSWKDVELAEREARVLSTLSHPNLPVYIEHFEEDGALYLVMEKIEGETLASLRRRRVALDSGDIARFLADADLVLRYLHARSPAIIHRDIKPGNVIRRADGSYAFVDFGSVRDQLKPEGGSTVVGTFGYMAPEQFQGRALPGSDVYAVAATALSLVTGREPEDLPHRGLAIDVPAALGKACEPWLVRALSAMLEPDPDKRPSQITARPPTQRATARAERESARERQERQRRAEPANQPESGREWQRREPWDWYALREQGREQRRAVREESRRFRRELKERIRDETRRARRHAREYRRSERGWLPPERHHGFGPAAPLILSIVVLALTVARLANWALFRLFLPVLLTMLSLFFGRGLQRAAWRCRDVGIAGDHGLLHAIEAVRGRLLGREHDGDEETEGEVVPEEAARDESADPARSEPAAHAEVLEKPKIRVSFTPTAEATELSDEADERALHTPRREQR